MGQHVNGILVEWDGLNCNINHIHSTSHKSNSHSHKTRQIGVSFIESILYMISIHTYDLSAAVHSILLHYASKLPEETNAHPHSHQWQATWRIETISEHLICKLDFLVSCRVGWQ